MQDGFAVFFNKINKLAMELMSYDLQNGKTATGTVYSIGQLCAKFQIWARGFGLSGGESLACWIYSDGELKKKHFGTIERAGKLAAAGFAKLGDVEIPDLSEI